MLASAVGWPDVVLACIAAIPSTMAVFLTYLIRREVRTPSGDHLGEVAERTHDLAAASVMHTSKLLSKVNGEPREHNERADD